MKMAVRHGQKKLVSSVERSRTMVTVSAGDLYCWVSMKQQFDISYACCMRELNELGCCRYYLFTNW